MSDLDARRLLVPFLFTIDQAGFQKQYGVSAYSLDDALVQLRAAGIDVDLSNPGVAVRERVRLTEDELRHLGPHMGPMQFRGVWYPRGNL
jgi:hypothetical protein